ncbi:MAG: hypothetical protein K2X47_04815 [Bdellovibrionales bacterium]|nr:hypothetical protein [Bdellovibrionales bacterium]
MDTKNNPEYRDAADPFRKCQLTCLDQCRRNGIDIPSGDCQFSSGNPGVCRGTEAEYDSGSPYKYYNCASLN